MADTDVPPAPLDAGGIAAFQALELAGPDGVPSHIGEPQQHRRPSRPLVFSTRPAERRRRRGCQARRNPAPGGHPRSPARRPGRSRRASPARTSKRVGIRWARRHSQVACAGGLECAPRHHQDARPDLACSTRCGSEAASAPPAERINAPSRPARHPEDDEGEQRMAASARRAS